ncbi:MAG TPA: hypothetical protein VGE29_15500 [Prosthecobacter sp.]
MKYLNSLLAVCLAAPAISFAQGAGSAAPATVALTVSYSVDALVARDENGKPRPGETTDYNEWSISKVTKDGDPISDESFTETGVKVVVYKYSNKQILEDLLEMDLLPGIGENDPTIAGWAIVQVTNAEGEEPKIYARHTSRESVEITEMVQITSGEGASAVAISGRTYDKTAHLANGDTKETSSRSYSYTFKTVASFSLNELMSGQGILTGGAKEAKLTYKDEGETFVETVLVPSAMKLASISGTGTIEIGTAALPLEVEGVLEGSISVAAAKAYLDIDAYLTPDIEF